MSENIKYTYWSWPKVFSHNDLLSLHEICNKNYNKNAIDNYATDALKTSKVKMTQWYNIKNKLYDVEQAFLNVAGTQFGFNVWPQYDNQYVFLNEYSDKNKSEYGWHNDATSSLKYDIKLTMLINISLNPYKGGKFYLFDSKGGTHLKQLDNPGDVLFFTSQQFHKVTPVTKGTRHSLTLFYNGPRFT